jgi:hypothetical protein
MLAGLDLGFHGGIFLGIEMQDPLNVDKVLSPYLSKNPTQNFLKTRKNNPYETFKTQSCIHQAVQLYPKITKISNSKFLPDSM